MGEPVPPESTLIKFIGPPLQDSFAEFCGFSAERAAEAIAAFRERYEPVGKFENMAAPGMADLCARLKARGYVLALASSKPESLCVPICEKFGFDSLGYQSLDGLLEAIGLDRFSQVLLFSTEGNTDPMKFRKVLWDGEYPTV